MSKPVAIDAIKQLFTEARSHHFWKDIPVSDHLLKEIYELTKWAPTSVNASPMRILFVKSAEAKEKLLHTLSGSNVDQVKAAPVTAIIAQDMSFHDHLPRLFPAFDARAMFVNNLELSAITAFRNTSLQGGYFMLAARALGLDVGPMSGFDNQKVDELFFKGTSFKSNFLCNLGHGEETKLYPRGPRLEFDEVAEII